MSSSSLTDEVDNECCMQFCPNGCKMVIHSLDVFDQHSVLCNGVTPEEAVVCHKCSIFVFPDELKIHDIMSHQKFDNHMGVQNMPKSPSVKPLSLKRSSQGKPEWQTIHSNKMVPFRSNFQVHNAKPGCGTSTSSSTSIPIGQPSSSSAYNSKFRNPGNYRLQNQRLSQYQGSRLDHKALPYTLNSRRSGKSSGMTKESWAREAESPNFTVGLRNSSEHSHTHQNGMNRSILESYMKFNHLKSRSNECAIPSRSKYGSAETFALPDERSHNQPDGESDQKPFQMYEQNIFNIQNAPHSRGFKEFRDDDINVARKREHIAMQRLSLNLQERELMLEERVKKINQRDLQQDQREQQLNQKESTLINLREEIEVMSAKLTRKSSPINNINCTENLTVQHQLEAGYFLKVGTPPPIIDTDNDDVFLSFDDKSDICLDTRSYQSRVGVTCSDQVNESNQFQVDSSKIKRTYARSKSVSSSEGTDVSNYKSLHCNTTIESINCRFQNPDISSSICDYNNPLINNHTISYGSGANHYSRPYTQRYLKNMEKRSIDDIDSALGNKNVDCHTVAGSSSEIEPPFSENLQLSQNRDPHYRVIPCTNVSSPVHFNTDFLHSTKTTTSVFLDEDDTECGVFNVIEPNICSLNTEDVNTNEKKAALENCNPDLRETNSHLEEKEQNTVIRLRETNSHLVEREQKTVIGLRETNSHLEEREQKTVIGLRETERNTDLDLESRKLPADVALPGTVTCDFAITDNEAVKSQTFKPNGRDSLILSNSQISNLESINRESNLDHSVRVEDGTTFNEAKVEDLTSCENPQISEIDCVFPATVTRRISARLRNRSKLAETVCNDRILSPDKSIPPLRVGGPVDLPHFVSAITNDQISQSKVHNESDLFHGKYPCAETVSESLPIFEEKVDATNIATKKDDTTPPCSLELVNSELSNSDSLLVLTTTLIQSLETPQRRTGTPGIDSDLGPNNKLEVVTISKSEDRLVNVPKSTAPNMKRGRPRKSEREVKPKPNDDVNNQSSEEETELNDSSEPSCKKPARRLGYLRKSSSMNMQDVNNFRNFSFDELYTSSESTDISVNCMKVAPAKRKVGRPRKDTSEVKHKPNDINILSRREEKVSSIIAMPEIPSKSSDINVPTINNDTKNLSVDEKSELNCNNGNLSHDGQTEVNNAGNVLMNMPRKKRGRPRKHPVSDLPTDGELESNKRILRDSQPELNCKSKRTAIKECINIHPDDSLEISSVAENIPTMEVDGHPLSENGTPSPIRRKRYRPSKDAVSPGPTKCGKCELQLASYAAFYAHALKEHAGLARPIGESQMFEDDGERLYLLKEALKKNKSLRCKSCNKTCKSFLGFDIHIKMCGKREADKYQPCPDCDEYVRITHMPRHRSGHRKPSDLDDSAQKGEEVSTEKVSRNCSTAMPKEAILNDIEDIIKDKPSTSEKKCTISRLLGSTEEHPFVAKYLALDTSVINDIADSLNNGNESKCPNGKCLLSFQNVRDFKRHIKMCKYSAFSFLCKICKFSSKSRRTMTKHADQHCIGDRMLNFASEFPLIVERYASHSVSFCDEFRAKNYSSHLFSELVCNISSWECENEFQIGINSIDPDSIPFKLYSSHLNPEWSILPNHGCCHSENGCTIFAGKAILSSAWCPMPDNASDIQYLALSVTSDPDTESSPDISTADNVSSWVEMWAMQLRGAGADAKMVFGFVSTHGTMLSVRWCPSGAYQEDRLGILAVCCSDGSVCIYVVPHPHQLSHSDGIYQKRPDLLLIPPDFIPFGSSCRKIDWFLGDGHEYVAGCYSNGYVSVWNLALKDEPWRMTESDGSIISTSIKWFSAHLYPCTSICFCPNTKGRHIFTAALDRICRTWDLEDLDQPMSDFRKGVTTDSIWLPYWNGPVLSYDESVGVHNAGTILKETDLFGGQTSAILPSEGTVWCIAPSYWYNGVAQATVKGVSVAVNHKAIRCSDTSKDYLKSVYSVFEYSIEEVPYSRDNSSQVEKSNTFGICFYDGLDRTPKTQTRQREQGERYLINQLKISTTISWNNNYGFHNWLFVGNNAGLGRFINLACITKDGVGGLHSSR